MIDTLLNASGVAIEAVLCVMVAVVLQRIGRIEKDVAEIGTKADEYHSKVDKIEGRFEAFKRYN